MYFPRVNRAIPLPMPDISQTPQGATLTDEEIIEQVKKGDIKLSDMTVSERERYGFTNKSGD